jgi:photosystem II stability/assembly factor-like uncharacterized protein
MISTMLRQRARETWSSGPSARAWRSLAFVGLAAVAVVVLGVARLGGWPLGPAAAAHPTATPGAWQLGLVSFGDADHGAVVMDGGTPTAADTYVTTNGGRSWTPRHVGLSATTFLDRDHAIAVVAPPTPRLESSADAGRTWVGLPAPVKVDSLDLLLNRAAGGPTFLDARDGWWLDAPPPPRSGPVMLWRTGDGGRTWRPVGGAGLRSGWQFSSPAPIDPSTAAVLAVPGHGALPLLLITRDGGETWSPVSIPNAPVEGGRVGLASGDAAQLLVDRGRLLLVIDLTTTAGDEFSHWTSVSRDLGQTWVRRSQAPASRASPFTAPLLDDAGRLLVADDHLLWASTDDGRTWQRQPLAVPAGDHAVAVVFARAGALMVAAGGPRSTGLPDLRLLRTGDGGRHWAELPLPKRPS